MKTYRVGKTICKSCIWWIINSIIRKPTAQLKIRQRLEQTHHQRGLNTENKCIKYLLYYYPIRKFKTIMGYHYIPIKWLKLKKKNRECQVWRWHRATTALIHCWWECKIIHLLWKTDWQFLMTLNIHLPYELAIPCLDIFHGEGKTDIHTRNLYANIENNCIC